MEQMYQYEMFETAIAGPEPEESLVEIGLRASFTHEGRTIDVNGFYACDGTWRVRFLPEEAGIYECRLYVPFQNAELVMEIECLPAPEGRHGIVRADGTHFRHADGTWFYPFGTTVYAMVHQEDELVDQTLKTLSESPFNKLRTCVFPKHYDYNHNEPPCYPFALKEGADFRADDPEREAAPGRWDLTRPNPEFWARLEGCISELDDLGIQCDLILFHPYDNWGFSKMTREEAFVYLEYATRRLAAFPNVWWSLANEYDLMDYTMEDWKAIAHFIREHDPYGHLLSNHQIMRPWDFSNEDTTHICLQTSELDHIGHQIQAFGKPAMVDECRYEGNIPLNWGNITGFELVNRFWTVVAQGGYCTHGETFYNKEEVLWWSKGGKLIGQSPARIGFLRNLIASLPGPLTYCGRPAVTREQFEAMIAKITPEQAAANQVLRVMKRSAWEEVSGMVNSVDFYLSSCGEEAYLTYYARNCTCQGFLKLPENGAYRVEIIDVWEMTRTTAFENASGEVKVDLPGKEGIALLATKMG